MLKLVCNSTWVLNVKYETCGYDCSATLHSEKVTDGT